MKVNFNSKVPGIKQNFSSLHRSYMKLLGKSGTTASVNTFGSFWQINVKKEDMLFMNSRMNFK